MTIHGVMLLASNTVDNINSQLASLQSALGYSITEVYSLQAAARPDFGFQDGISDPAVQGFQTPLPGQAVVPTGEILVGETGGRASRDGCYVRLHGIHFVVSVGARAAVVNVTVLSLKP
ncbi:hypothetical protein B0H14DRAFT_2604205 [Mycena olivaceomarginata]|nr:hypothetical protein B0H14DRAFT_2604205 [Mycena olivaceomarginata]